MTVVDGRATLVLPPRRDVLYGPGLGDFLAEARITHVTLPPSALAMVPERELPYLETIVCAGEALPQRLVARRAPGRAMFNAYGQPCRTTDPGLGGPAGEGGVPARPGVLEYSLVSSAACAAHLSVPLDDRVGTVARSGRVAHSGPSAQVVLGR
ncbi:hypothetical protein [Streptomyces sp. MC1]|uniref:hypothetical protein n=1 Tax=Streptomyces sp. MC1 TaxID=295105 RepID=UPI001E282590|nr:hypothetical protein [Streptomyces sp. MC1]